MTKNKIGYKLGTHDRTIYEDAQFLDTKWEWNERWLKNALSARITNASQGYLDRIDYRELLHQARRLRGVARRILKSKTKKVLEERFEPSLFPGLKEQARKEQARLEYQHGIRPK